MARSSKRAGCGVHKGSLNPKITISTEAPTYPKNKDIWIDSNASPIKMYCYSTSISDWFLLITSA